MRAQPLLPLLVALSALAGCARDRPRDGDARADTAAGPPFNMENLPLDSVAPVTPAAQLPRRPGLLVDSVRIEGDWQRTQLTLVRPPAGFEPPFTTYVPEGLRVEFSATDTAASVRFVAAFAGQVNPEAYLQVRVYPAGSSELLVRSMVDVFLRERDPRLLHVRPSQGWPWTIAAWDFDYAVGLEPTHMIGTIGIARHGQRFLHVLAHYPAEYGDGVGPRFHRILQEWRWEDDGSRLARSGTTAAAGGSD